MLSNVLFIITLPVFSAHPEPYRPSSYCVLMLFEVKPLVEQVDTTKVKQWHTMLLEVTDIDSNHTSLAGILPHVRRDCPVQYSMNRRCEGGWYPPHLDHIRCQHSSS